MIKYHAELPGGYKPDIYTFLPWSGNGFDDGLREDGNINEYEVATLYTEGGWEYETGQASLVLDGSYCVVGARSQSNNLIGVGTLDRGSIGEGFLEKHLEGLRFDGLMVHPAHRNRGIGSALSSWRACIADEFQLPAFISDLDPTNTIRHKYLALGFTAVRGGYYREPRRENR